MKSKLFIFMLLFLTIGAVFLFRQLPDMFTVSEKTLFYLPLFGLAGITLVGGIKVMLK